MKISILSLCWTITCLQSQTNWQSITREPYVKEYFLFKWKAFQTFKGTITQDSQTRLSVLMEHANRRQHMDGSFPMIICIWNSYLIRIPQVSRQSTLFLKWYGTFASSLRYKQHGTERVGEKRFDVKEYMWSVNKELEALYARVNPILIFTLPLYTDVFTFFKYPFKPWKCFLTYLEFNWMTSNPELHWSETRFYWQCLFCLCLQNCMRIFEIELI